MSFVPVILIGICLVLLFFLTIIVLRQSKDKLSESELQKIQSGIIQRIQDESRADRQEMAGLVTNFQQVVNSQLASQEQRIKTFEEGFSSKLEQFRGSWVNATAQSRQEQQTTLAQMSTTINESFQNIATTNNSRLNDIRQTLEDKLLSLQSDNAEKLGLFASNLEKLTISSNEKQETMRQVLTDTTAAARKEQAESINTLRTSVYESLNSMAETNRKGITEVRNTLETKITQMQQDNAAKLEEMRKTVDEKLHATLEQRLGESFRQVSDRLENVYKSLGEMTQLAQGMGDLKRILTNVKTRGTWGEVQLGMILEQMMTTGQYAKNVETVPGSGEYVEYALKLPGKGEQEEPVWLPIDAKFPKEPYERLVIASEAGDAAGVAKAGKELEAALDAQAKTIADKYLSVPHTTDFGLMFLPTEGLYAEAVRRPGLVDSIQRKYRINIAGPSTLTALLNSLQIGFKTLAIEKRSSEVWKILGAVKTEFGKFSDVLASTKKALEKVTRNIEQAEVRTRAMDRKLRTVEEIPVAQSRPLLGLEADSEENKD
jgi:DNA recombination protein RmuC